MGPEFIDEFTPELSIALYEQYREKGVGTRLLCALLQQLKENGVKQAMLSAKKKTARSSCIKGWALKLSGRIRIPLSW